MGLSIEPLPFTKLNPSGVTVHPEHIGDHSRPSFLELLHSRLHEFHGPTLFSFSFLNLYLGDCLKYTLWTKAACM